MPISGVCCGDGTYCLSGQTCLSDGYCSDGGDAGGGSSRAGSPGTTVTTTSQDIIATPSTQGETSTASTTAWIDKISSSFSEETTSSPDLGKREEPLVLNPSAEILWWIRLSTVDPGEHFGWGPTTNTNTMILIGAGSPTQVGSTTPAAAASPTPAGAYPRDRPPQSLHQTRRRVVAQVRRAPRPPRW